MPANVLDIHMRVNRLLSMLLLISKKGTVTGKELAEHFEVSLRTIYRDIEKISEAGIPIASIGGRGGGYSIMESFSVDNLFLNKDEARTFMAVMNQLNFEFGKNEKLHDMSLKIENTFLREQDHPEKWSITMSPFNMKQDWKEHLSLLSKAIEENKLVVFDYINRNLEYLERTVEPLQIAYSAGQWYLFAFCRERNDYRRFKLVRVKNLKLGNPFVKKEIAKEQMQKIIQDSYQRHSITVTLQFTSRIGAQLSEYFPMECIRQSENGSFVVMDQFPYEEGLLKFILSFGKECQIIEPDYLREELKEYVKELVRSYND